MSVAVTIVLLSAVEAYVRCISCRIGKTNTLSGLSRHLEFSDGDRVAKNGSFCSPNIFRKSHERVSVYSKRFGNGVQKSGPGELLPPYLPHKG